jgi:class 3 adenylate cyclase
MSTRCASCGHENRPGASFCDSCGTRLGRVCGKCQADIRPEARFCDRCGQPTTAAAGLVPGNSAPIPASFVAGRYQVRRFLGEGARKRVYLAHDTRLDRDVAFALIKTDGLDEAGLARVRREAQAMGRLGDHPHIVTVHDIGDEGPHPYIVSQYMSGGSVDDLLQRAEQHRLPLEQCLRIADQISQALDHAHSCGVIHRDLKPGNVWLTQDGAAKLGDFGLAVATDRSRLTGEGMMVGTVAYMPPEQALGRRPDGRSDLYALGAMLYEMVTGRPPFLGDDAVAVISQHINTPPVAPSWHNSEIPRSLEALILRLLAKDPEERPEGPAAVRLTLAAIASAKLGSGETKIPDETNPLDRLASGVFVGREREMDELRAGFEGALSGRGRVLMLVGEPGIGKTRTAEELVTYARLRKAQVLWGRCYEGEGAPAYWPWVQAIRSYVHERDAKTLLSEMGSGAADIAQIVSEVRDRLPGLPAPPSLEPEQARFRLFDGVTTFLKNATRGEPLVLVLDDLHWADKPSLLLLQFLAHELHRARLLVIGTYRDIELGRQHPLAQALGELAREQLAQRIVLRGLSERDVSRFIEITAGLKPPEPLVSAVYKETEGNPFFVNEVVRLLVTDGRLEHPEQVKSWSVDIPQGVREVISRRLDRLSAACNSVLSIAAVIGREFGLDTLERITGLSGDRLLEALEEAVDARVLIEVPRLVGRYRFSHALIRETLYDELSTTRRVRVHRQVGEALEALYGAHPEAYLAELAYHFSEAAQSGDVQKAIDYAVRAGDRAATQMAHEEAVRHYELALQALDIAAPGSSSEPGHTEPQRCKLLLSLGEALWRAGSFPEARETYLRAADTARELGSEEQFARAALGFGGRLPAFEAGIFNEPLVRILEEALQLLGETGGLLRAQLTARLAEALTFSDQRERRQSLSRQGIQLARQANDPAVLCDVLRATHWALWGPENLEERLALTSEFLQLGERVGNQAAELEGRIYRVSHLLEQGNVSQADLELRVFTRVAEGLRQPYYLWAGAAFDALQVLREGRFEEAEGLIQRALEIGQRNGNQNAPFIFGAQIFAVWKEQGRLADLEGTMQGYADEFPLLPIWRCGLALLYKELGRQTEASREFERLAVSNFATLPRDLFWLSCISLMADVCAFLEDAPRAETLYEMLLPYANRIVVLAPVGACWGSVAHYVAGVATTLRRWDDAAQHFDGAIEANTRIGARAWVAHSQYRYAEMLLARKAAGDRSKALQLLAQALDAARALGMKVLLERALALKLRAQGVAAADFKTSIDAVVSVVERERPDLRRHAAPDGTVTILFSDIEGSTAMTERLGDQRWVQLLRTHNTIVREHIVVHGGFEVKSQGDGFMVAFASARRALLCAIDVQRAFASHATQYPDEPLNVRIGLHTGEAIKEADDFFGKNVILASRIANAARGGEILVSSLFKELTESAGEFAFGPSRDVELKGLSSTRRVFPVVW